MTENTPLILQQQPLLETGPRLYQLVRTDIHQLNPGKLGAQCGHFATQFVFDALGMTDYLKNSTFSDENLPTELEAWRQQGGGGFGTKITLAATEREIIEIVEHLRDTYNMLTNTVVDPTYPAINHYGDFYTTEELTGGYVFAPSYTGYLALDYLKQFPLHP